MSVSKAPIFATGTHFVPIISVCTTVLAWKAMKETALIVEVRRTIAPIDNHVQTCISCTP